MSLQVVFYWQSKYFRCGSIVKVSLNRALVSGILSRAGLEKPCPNLVVLFVKFKYYREIDSESVL